MMLGVLLAGFLVQAMPCAAGAEHFRKGDLSAAEISIASALEKTPSSYCEKVMGAVYAARAEYSKAELHFSRACSLNPKEPDACYFWSRALYALDRFEDSIRALGKVGPGVTLEWKLATARGQAYDALGQAEAERELKRGIAERKKDPRPPGEIDPLLALGSFYYRQGRGKDALELLRSAEASYRKLAPYHYQLGRAQMAEGNWEDAAAALEEAVKLQAQYHEAHGLLSRVYYRLGKNELGRQHAEKAK